MQVGTTKDQSLYNKPSAAVHAGALGAGILPQYNTVHTNVHSLGLPYIHNRQRGHEVISQLCTIKRRYVSKKRRLKKDYVKMFTILLNKSLFANLLRISWM